MASTADCHGKAIAGRLWQNPALFSVTVVCMVFFRYRSLRLPRGCVHG